MIQSAFSNNRSQAFISAQEHKAHKRLLKSKSSLDNREPRHFAHIKHGTQNGFSYKQRQSEVYKTNQMLSRKISHINRAVTPLNPVRMK